MSQITHYGTGTVTPPVLTLTGNAGGAVGPNGAGNINTLGGNNITSTGNPGTNTLTFSVTGTTNHSLQLGNATGSLTSLGVATNGQLPIGSVGVDPVLATLTPGTGIAITNGAGSITIAATGTTTLNYMLVNTTPYVVAANDDFLGVDSSGAPITVQLPNAPSTGRVFVIKDITGSAAGNNITVTTVGGVVLIDAAATFVMNTAYQSIQVLFNGTQYFVF